LLTELQWQETFLYIHLNPIKHRFTKSIDAWKWTSWQAYNQPGKKSLLKRDYYRNFFDGMDHVNAVITSKKELLMSREFE